MKPKIKLFGRFYSRVYGMGYIKIILFVAIPVTFLGTAIQFRSTPTEYAAVQIAGIVVLFLVLIWFLARSLTMSMVLRGRKYIKSGIQTNSKITRSAVYEESRNKASRVQTMHVSYCQISEDSLTYDVRFDLYSRGGDYVTQQLFYTVLETKLSRPLPHLVFDSKLAKRSQFGNLYVHAQKLSLEGDFDKHFEIYAPSYYQIDSLSFIAPDAMQALLALKAYDIEIIDDSLFCYAPLLTESDIAQVEPLFNRLRGALNDNIRSYKDSWAQDENNAKRVTEFGSRLRQRPLKYLPSFLISASSLVVYSTVLAKSLGSIAAALINPFTVVLIVLSAANLAKIYDLYVENKRAVRSFAAHIKKSPTELNGRS